MIEFTVYARHGCHLCEDLLLQLHELQQAHGFLIRDIDIDADPQLVERYGTRVPVVTCGEREICHYFLDQAAVMQVLSNQANTE